MENNTIEKLLDIIEKQQLIIDAIIDCLDNETKLLVMCEAADRIFLEKNKKLSYNGENN